MKQLPPLAQYCKKRRHELNMTVLELAARCGVKHSYINKVESGEIRRPRNEKAEVLAVALETPLAKINSLIESADIVDLGYDSWIRLWRMLIKLEAEDLDFIVRTVRFYINAKLYHARKLGGSAHEHEDF